MHSTSTEINLRQNKLIGDYSNSIAVVAGLGGIGSWVAIDLALIGVGTLFVYDADRIEASNLNRTLFKESQIGDYKTKAVKELISERRKDCLVLGFEEFFDAEMLNKLEGIDYFFDCTDTIRLRNSIQEYSTKKTTELEIQNIKTVKKKSKEHTNTTMVSEKQDFKLPQYVKLGYDGFEGTICVNDFNSGKWGEDSSYRNVLSFVGTPQILSALAVTEMLIVKPSEPYTKTRDICTLLNLTNSQKLI